MCDAPGFSLLLKQTYVLHNQDEMKSDIVSFTRKRYTAAARQAGAASYERASFQSSVDDSMPWWLGVVGVCHVCSVTWSCMLCKA